jgi:Protein of unknown function (DUF3352)
MRAALTALVAMLVLAAGCGGADVGAGEASGAELLKPGALVYWETESDPESDQWQQVEELIMRFPDGERLIAEARKELESETEITWEDVEEALGGQTGFAVYARSMADVQFVAVMNPNDPEKTMALVERANKEEPEDPLIARRVDDYVVFSDKESSIDAALKGEDGQSLADDEEFKAGLEELPEDSLSRLYVDAAGALQAFGGADAESAQAFRMLGLDDIDFFAAWAKARDDGAELAGVLRGEGADKLLGAGEPYTSKLLELVPADAFAFTSFQGSGATEQFEALRDNPLYRMALGDIEQELGVKLDDLIGLFDGEVAFYAAPGAPIPALTLLLDSDDPAQALQTAKRLLTTLAGRTGGEVTEDGDVTTAVFEGFSINLAVVESTLVVTTTKNAIEDLQTSGDKLGDSDRYKDALGAAGVPDEYTALLYIDLEEAVRLVLSYAESSGEVIPPEVSRNLEPLRSLVGYGEKDGNLGKSLVFVEIE